MTPRVYTAISVEKVRDIALVCLPAGTVSKLEMITHWGLYGIERCKFISSLRKLTHAIYGDLFTALKLKMSLEKKLIFLICLLKTLIVSIR